VLVELERRPSFLVTKTVLMATTSPSRQAGQVDGGSPGDKDCVDGHDLPLQAGYTLAPDAQTPNLLTALIMILVPCRNSSLEFILVLYLDLSFEHLRLLSFSVASEMFPLCSSQSVQMASPPFFPDVFLEYVSKDNDLMYIVGDMNVVELVTLLREELVCSHASLLIFSS